MRLRKFAFFFFMVSTALCCAQDNLAQESATISRVLENAFFCVKSTSEDRIYLKEDKIFPTSEGLFVVLNENGDVVRLPTMFSDSSGCFVEMLDRKVTKPCTLCGCERISGAVKCPNPNCPSNQRKKKE